VNYDMLFMEPWAATKNALDSTQVLPGFLANDHLSRMSRQLSANKGDNGGAQISCKLPYS
jgi:hypothetical protein